MRLFILIILLSLVSCGDSQQESEEERDALSGRFMTPEFPNIILVEKNRYKQFEEMVNQHLKEKGNEGIFPEMDPICRTFLGCIKMCSYMQSENCTLLSAPNVLELFEEFVVESSESEMVNHLEWIFEDPHVSYYFQYVDQNQTILSRMIERISDSESCPLFENQDVFYNEEENQVSLYIASSNDPQEGVKKVVDSNQHDFNFPLFKGLMRQCLDQKDVFSYAMEKENKQGIFLGHQLLDKSCGSNPLCIQLAYCRTNSEDIQDYAQNIFSISNLSCHYEDFQSLTSPTESSEEGVASEEKLGEEVLSEESSVTSKEEVVQSEEESAVNSEDVPPQ